MASYKRPTQYKKKWYPKKTDTIVDRTRKVCDWSGYQKDIFNEVEKGTGNLVINAVPGSGKTTTIVEALYYTPEDSATIFLAFNKSIQTELANKVPERVECKTLHGLGFAALRQAFGKINVDNDKVCRAIVGLRGEAPETSDVRENLRKAVSLCKGYMADQHNDIEDVMDRHGIEAGDDENERSQFISDIQKVLELSVSQYKMIDFDDMIYLPNRLNIVTPKYNRIFVDETQDLNNAQVELVMKMCSADSRMAFVGDRFQAIYGFRGAMSDAIDRIIDRTSAKTLPLSVSYRCAKRIVELAREVQPDIEASPTAPDGIIEEATKENMLEKASPGDFIISRTNAPLVPLCLAFLKEGKRANIQGRDMGKSLSYMIKRSGEDSVPGFLNWLENWKTIEVDRLSAKNKDYSYVLDRYECMLSFSEGATTLNQVKSNIEKIFDDADDSSRIMLGTAHKFKGLERDKVWLLKQTFKPGRTQEESNIWYVALTRAKTHLCLVNKI